MSDETNRTTRTQQVLVTLISLVLILLIVQIVLISSERRSATTRLECLQAGHVWSDSAGECYETDADVNAAADVQGSAETNY